MKLGRNPCSLSNKSSTINDIGLGVCAALVNLQITDYVHPIPDLKLELLELVTLHKCIEMMPYHLLVYSVYWIYCMGVPAAFPNRVQGMSIATITNELTLRNRPQKWHKVCLFKFYSLLLYTHTYVYVYPCCTFISYLPEVPSHMANRIHWPKASPTVVKYFTRLCFFNLSFTNEGQKPR